MSNLTVIPLDNVTLPAYLQNRKVDNSALLAGLPQGQAQYPVIGMKGTRFAVRADGTETVLPTVEIPVVILGAKANLDKTYYANKFDPSNTEAKTPDCFSKDGNTPDPSATLKQHTACAGCPQNVFGSGTDNQGNPGAGKACKDTKTIAIFTLAAKDKCPAGDIGVFGIKIAPASLKGYKNYVLETTRRGIDLSTAVTILSFDPKFSFPVLKWDFGGFLQPNQIAMIEKLKAGSECAEIIDSESTPTLVPPSVAAAPAPQVAPPVSAPLDPFAGMGTTPPPAEPEKPKAVRKPKVQEIKPVEDAVDDSDDLAALAGELGISL